MIMIRLNDITLSHGSLRLFDGCSLEIATGACTALVGRNGSGKSTLLKAICGNLRPQKGTIEIAGKDVSLLKPAELARLVAMVSTERVRVANLRCVDVVAMGRAPYTNWMGRLQPADYEKVTDALRQVNMTGYVERTMDKMSDGECQRIMIARALAQETPIMLLDEPTSFLDVPGRRQIADLLASLAGGMGKTILYSTHEIDLAVKNCTQVILIDGGKVQSLDPKNAKERERIDSVFRLPL